MYSIYADDLCIYSDISPMESVKLQSPVLTLSDSSAGSLKMTVPPTNAGYGYMNRLTTSITVKKNGEEIWSGRILTEEGDFYNNRILYCEGELAFLNDSIQPQGEFHNISVSSFFTHLITVHNSQVEADKRFTVGNVTVTDSNDSLYRYTNYESTIECIYDKLIDKLGGHIRIRKVGGTRYIDYLADYPHTSSQVIRFGKNLMDFTRNWDNSEFATVLIPLGAQLENSDIDALPSYTTVKSVNNNSLFVESSTAVNTYGRIVKTAYWDDVKTPSRLLTKAQNYLSDIQFDDMILELSAIDLHYFDADVEEISILDRVRAVSPPHGMDRYFPVSEMEIPLDDPSNTIFRLGGTEKTTLTSTYSSVRIETSSEIETARATLRQEFRAADGVLESTIEATYATKTELSTLSQTASEIRTEVSQKVGTSEFRTYMRQNYDSFLLGFNDSSGVIQLSTSGMSIYSGGQVLSTNRLLRLNGNGMEIWRDGNLLGKIGTNTIDNYPNYRGLVFDLDANGNYMSWAVRTSSAQAVYMMVLTYAKAGAIFGSDGFYLGADIFMSGHTINRANLTEVRAGGYATFSGSRTFVTAVRSDGNGGVECDTVTCTINNGMFIN